jgi:hypothetical protein
MQSEQKSSHNHTSDCKESIDIHFQLGEAVKMKHICDVYIILNLCPLKFIESDPGTYFTLCSTLK